MEGLPRAHIDTANNMEGITIYNQCSHLSLLTVTESLSAHMENVYGDETYSKYIRFDFMIWKTKS
jgi:hypothetical protein